MANQNIGTRTAAPKGKTGSVTTVKQNRDISANNQPSSQSYRPGGTRPIVTGTKPNGSRTGTVTRNVLSGDDARSNNRNTGGA